MSSAVTSGPLGTGTLTISTTSYVGGDNSTIATSAANIGTYAGSPRQIGNALASTVGALAGNMVVLGTFNNFAGTSTAATDIAFNGNIALTSVQVFAINNGTTIWNGVVSGAGGISKGGTGVLYLTNANTYTGLTTAGAQGAGSVTPVIPGVSSLNAGILRLKGDTGTIATSASPLTIDGGAQFDIDNSGTANPTRLIAADGITLNGGIFSIEAPANTDRTVTVTGAMTLNAGGGAIKLTSNSSTGATGKATLTAGSLTRAAGQGPSFNFQRLNTNTGTGTALAHLIYTTAPTVAGLIGVTVNGKAPVYQTTADTDGNAVAGVVEQSTIIWTSNTDGDWATDANWTLSGGATTTGSGPPAGALVIIKNNMTLSVANAGTPQSILFDTPNANAAGSVDSLKSTTGTFSLALTQASFYGIAVNDGVTATIGGSGVQALPINMAANELIVNTFGTGNITLVNNITSTVAAAASCFTKNGAGICTLQGTNTFPGAIICNGGINAAGGQDGKLSISSETNIGGAVAQNLCLLSGGTLQMTAPMTLASHTIFQGATGGQVEVTAAGTGATISTAMTANSGVFTKQGVGQLIMSGASTRTAATIINAGILTLNNATALGTATAPVQVNSGGTLEAGSVNPAYTAITVNDGGILKVTGGIINSGNAANAVTLTPGARITVICNAAAGGSEAVSGFAGGGAGSTITVIGDPSKSNSRFSLQTPASTYLGTWFIGGATTIPILGVNTLVTTPSTFTFGFDNGQAFGDVRNVITVQGAKFGVVGSAGNAFNPIIVSANAAMFAINADRPSLNTSAFASPITVNSGVTLTMQAFDDSTGTATGFSLAYSGQMTL